MHNLSDSRFGREDVGRYGIVTLAESAIRADRPTVRPVRSATEPGKRKG
jgi:hypothetical protein